MFAKNTTMVQNMIAAAWADRTLLKDETYVNAVKEVIELKND